MAREHLEGREEWQGEAGARGMKAEDVFHELMIKHLQGSQFKATKNPRNSQGIYGRRHRTNRHRRRQGCFWSTLNVT